MAEGTEITVTMSFGGLERDSDPNDVDYIFRADVKNSADGNADGCEDQKGGYGLGVERYMKQVDENPEVRTGTVSASCEPGDYTVEVSISSPSNVELASATADFTVNAPGQQQQPEPPSTDATLSNLALSGVYFGTFYPATTGYNASVANGVDETTVTPTVNHDGATYAIKLGGVTDADGVMPLAVGSNVITIEVTAEAGKRNTDLHRNRQPRCADGLRACRDDWTLAVRVRGRRPRKSPSPCPSPTWESDTDTSDTDYIFRTDVVDADACRGRRHGQ